MTAPWIKHNGRVCPVEPDVVVDVRLRWRDMVIVSLPAWKLGRLWDHGRHPGRDADNDIMGYRLAERAPMKEIDR